MSRFGRICGCKKAARYCLAVFIIVTSGCAAPKIKRHPKRPPPDARHIIAQIISASQDVRDLSGFSKFRIQSQGKSKSGTIAVNLKKDNFLRLGFLNFLGQPVHYFLANKEHLLSYNPGKKTAFSGKPLAKNVNRLIGVRVKIRDLVYFLLGGPPDLTHLSEESVTYESVSDRYRLVAEGADGTDELMVSPDTHRPVRYRSYDKVGKMRLLVKWDDFRKFGDVAFATKVLIELPQDMTVIEIRYTDFDLNSGTGTFSIDIPSGTKTVLLDG